MKLTQAIIGTTLITTLFTGCVGVNTKILQPGETQASTQIQTGTPETQQPTQEEMIQYTNRDLGIKFSYPKSWGKPTEEHSTFDPDCATKKIAPNTDVLTVTAGPLTIIGMNKNTCTEIDAMIRYYNVFKDQADFDLWVAFHKNAKDAKIITWNNEKISVSLLNGEGCTGCEIGTSFYNPKAKYSSIHITLKTPQTGIYGDEKNSEDNQIWENNGRTQEIEFNKTYQGLEDALNLSSNTPIEVRKEIQTFYDLIKTLEFTS